MADQQELDWGDIDIDEELTEEGLAAAEAMGKIPLGQYLCECVKSVPVQQDFNSYSCIASKLSWKIHKMTMQDNAKVDGDVALTYAGRIITDEINQAPTGKFEGMEKNGMRNRRILAAKRIGLISSSKDKITTKMWAVDVLGKMVLVNYVDDSWENEKGKTIFKAIVAFDGYESADGLNVADAEPDLDDI